MSTELNEKDSPEWYGRVIQNPGGRWGWTVTFQGERPSMLEFGPEGARRSIRPGQKVYSNGRIFVEDGRMGIVVEILPPYENGRTDDVIVVHFEGNSHSSIMKLKDLDLDRSC